MKKLSCGVLSLSVFIMCFTPVSFAADKEISDQQKAQNLSSDSWIASGRELLGPSWSKNPKKLGTFPSALLYQFTANYSYSGQDGNVETEKHNGSGELILRKHLFTSVTRYEVNKNETEKILLGNSTTVESESFFQSFRYPITEWMQVVGGATWRKDSAKYLENRTIYFGGALFDLIDRPNLLLTTGIFYGYSDDTEYMNDSLTKKRKFADFTPVDNYESDDIYLKQMLRWNISDKVAFTENAQYTQLLKDTEYYYWIIKLGLEIELTKHISLITSYTVDYAYNSFIEAIQVYLDEQRAAGESAGDIEKIDTSLSVGIKISF